MCVIHHLSARTARTKLLTCRHSGTAPFATGGMIFRAVTLWSCPTNFLPRFPPNFLAMRAALITPLRIRTPVAIRPSTPDAHVHMSTYTQHEGGHECVNNSPTAPNTQQQTFCNHAQVFRVRAHFVLRLEMHMRAGTHVQRETPWQLFAFVCCCQLHP